MGGANSNTASQQRGPEVVALGASDFVLFFLLALALIIVLPRYLLRSLQQGRQRRRAGTA